MSESALLILAICAMPIVLVVSFALIFLGVYLLGLLDK